MRSPREPHICKSTLTASLALCRITSCESHQRCVKHPGLLKKPGNNNHMGGGGEHANWWFAGWIYLLSGRL